MKKISLPEYLKLEPVSSDPKSPVVDIRSKKEYNLSHLANSLNVMTEGFEQRLFEFPPASVKEKENSWISVVCNSNQGDKMAEFARKLESKGYSVKYCIMWQEIDGGSSVGLPTQCRDVLVSGHLYHIIFNPNPSLVSNIDFIESSLLETLGNSATPTARRQLKALDLGCGCSRDLVYLASSREKSGVQWVGYGIDSLEFCLAKARILSIRAHVQDRIFLYHMDISNTGDMRQIPRTKDIANSKLYKQFASELLTSSDWSAESLFASSLENFPTSKVVDLILCIRFINRSFLPVIDEMLSFGGFVFISTFVIGPGIPAFEKPRPQHCVISGELSEFFNFLGYRVVVDIIETIEDGRPVNTFIAQKPKTNTQLG